MARAPFQVLVLPYRITAGQLEVAILRRADYPDVWQFVSGGGEDEESPGAAARRELAEEVGIVAQSLLALDAMTMIPACWFRAWAQWPDDVLLVPEHAFAVDIGQGEIVLSDEHLDLAWLGVVPAMDRLRFDSNKNALWELNERLFPKPRGKRPAYL